MTRMKNFVLVPYWVYETLHRNQMNLGDCLDFGKIRPIFSAADLAAFQAIQGDLGYLIGDPSGPYGPYMLWQKWDESARAQEDRALLMNTIVPLSIDEGVLQECRDRLFSADARRGRDVEPFITYDIAPDVGAVVVYPGHFTSKTFGELQFRALEAILKVLYVYSKPDEVARTPWFRQYLLGLSIKQPAA